MEEKLQIIITKINVAIDVCMKLTRNRILERNNLKDYGIGFLEALQLARSIVVDKKEDNNVT